MSRAEKMSCYSFGWINREIGIAIARELHHELSSRSCGFWLQCWDGCCSELCRRALHAYGNPSGPSTVTGSYSYFTGCQGGSVVGSGSSTTNQLTDCWFINNPSGAIKHINTALASRFISCFYSGTALGACSVGTVTISGCYFAAATVPAIPARFTNLAGHAVNADRPVALGGMPTMCNPGWVIPPPPTATPSTGFVPSGPAAVSAGVILIPDSKFGASALRAAGSEWVGTPTAMFDHLRSPQRTEQDLRGSAGLWKTALFDNSRSQLDLRDSAGLTKTDLPDRSLDVAATDSADLKSSAPRVSPCPCPSAEANATELINSTVEVNATVPVRASPMLGADNTEFERSLQVQVSLCERTQLAPSREGRAPSRRVPATSKFAATATFTPVPTRSNAGQRVTFIETISHSITASWSRALSPTLTWLDRGETLVPVDSWVVVEISYWVRSVVLRPIGTAEQAAPSAVSAGLVIGLSVGVGVAIALTIAVIVYVRREEGAPSQDEEQETAGALPAVRPESSLTRGSSLVFSNDDTQQFLGDDASERVTNEWALML